MARLESYPPLKAEVGPQGDWPVSRADCVSWHASALNTSALGPNLSFETMY